MTLYYSYRVSEDHIYIFPIISVFMSFLYTHFIASFVLKHIVGIIKYYLLKSKNKTMRESISTKMPRLFKIVFLLLFCCCFSEFEIVVDYALLSVRL